MLKYREARMVADMLKGDLDIGQAARKHGLPAWMARNPGRHLKDVQQALTTLQAELVQHTLDVGLADAAELHEYLSDALRADMRDIRNSDGSFKDQDEWPPIWGQMMEAGDVDVEYASERSHDGETKDKAGGWDAKGKVVKVKLKFASKVRLVEMLGKLKAVDAFKEQSKGDLHVHLHEQQRIREKLVSARKRYAKVIEAQATPLHIEDTANATGCSALTEGLAVDNKEDE